MRQLSSRALCSALLSLLMSPAVFGQASLTSTTTAYSQNFDALAVAGTTNVMPASMPGWTLTETGGGARDDERYAADTGGSGTGDTYSYGSAAAVTDRAFGTLRSGTLIPVIGAQFQNNTCHTINSIAIGYTGEEWRLGTAGRSDRLDFQYSLDATSLSTGTWVDVNALDFSTPVTTVTGAKDGNAAANRIVIAPVTISSLTIAHGATFWIRWNDIDASGADDGLAVDDFTLLPTGTPITPTLSVADVSENEGSAGTRNLTVTVSLDCPSASPVTFDIATSPGTAVSPDDYTHTAVIGATIPAGSTTYSFTVPVVGDTVLEGDENFIVTVSNVSSGVTAGDLSATISLFNDDGPPTISIADPAPQSEGTTPMTFIVSLSTPAPAGGVEFDITTDSSTGFTATPGSDYVARSEIDVVIPEGQQQYSFTVTLTDDALDENNETFGVNLSAISNATAGDITATGTITDNDPSPTFSIANVTDIETDAGSHDVTFTVTLSAASALQTTVDYAINDGTATAPADYVFGTSGTLTFAPGDTSETFTVSINGDVTPEGNEFFTVTLSNPTNAGIGTGTALGVILEDDPISIAAVNTPYGENFNTLAVTGTANVPTPSGWTFSEAGGGARDNELYAADNGSSGTGDTYSYGNSADRALGGLASGTLQSTIGASFQNDTGVTITTLSISYTGEQWRFGQEETPTPNSDVLDFQYSTNATWVSDLAATWTNVNPLDFNSPVITGPTGNLDGNAAPNRTAVGYTITGLSIAPGTTFWIRWNDPNIGGNDDGLAVDDFTILANIAGGVLTVDDVVVTEGNAGTVNATFTVMLSQAAGVGGVSFDITTADNTATAPSDYLANTITGAVIPEGQTTYTFTVTVNGDTDVEPSETFLVTVTNVGGATLSDGQGIGTIASDDFTFTRIHTIQGSGLQSPLAGSVVTVEGIVTGIKTGGSGGFFVQEQVADYDLDPLTSEGIFVFTGGSVPAGVAIGNLVAVSGTVTEFPSSATPHTLTELSGTITVNPLSGEPQPLPAPIVLTAADGAPSSNLSQYERYEGMRVTATLTVVAPTAGSIDENDATASSNGVFYAVIQGVARPFREPGIEQTYTIPPEATCPACIDRFDENPEKIRVDSDNQPGATQLNVTAGQTVSNITGPLDYGFFEYTLLPEAATVPIVTGDSTADPAPAPLATELTVSGFNLFHFFDTVDDAGVGDVVLTPAAFNNRLNKASLAIRNILQTPDVIGVVEVDNINTLQALATRINSDTAGVTNYVGYLQEGNDVGSIDVGFLVDTNRVTVQAVTQVGKDTTWVNPHTGLVDSSELNDRPPLVLEASIPRSDGTLYEFTVIVNHLRSLIGVEENTAGGRRVRAKRAAQAEFLANYVQSRQVADPTEKIVLVGDFNAFEFNDGFVDVMGTIKGTPAPASEVVEPTDDLVNPDLTNLIETLPQQTRYTYTFDGNAQAIDHALVNAAMLPSVSRFVVAHLDADYPNIFYGDSTRPERLSDHDATLAYFDLSPLPRVSISDGSVTEGASGTTPMTFTVTLSGPVATPVTVNYTTSNGTATAGSDYIAETGTVTFAANDVSETITIDVMGDLLFEANETFTVTLSNPSVTVMINDGTATGTITNDDAPASMNIGDAAVTEGNAGMTTMTFTVTLSNPVPEPVTVTYTTSNGTAIAGTDYVAESGTITFLANDQSEQITIDVIGDTDFEGNETFTVTLSGASPTATIVDGVATGTINNDDVPSGMFITDASANETNGVTTMTFTVSLANPVGSTVTVDYATSDGTATAGSDYVARSGTLTFLPGDQSETITVTINGDTTFEPDETFTVTLSNATATTTISDATATGTILNDEAAVADLTLSMTFSPSSPGPGQMVTYTLVVSNNGPQPATGVTVTDDLPNGMIFVSANSTQGTCTGTDPVQCNVGGLAVGQSATITIVAQLPANAAGPYVNSATADANENDATAAAAAATISLPAHSEADIPTLSEWMLIMLAMMLAAIAAAKLKM